MFTKEKKRKERKPLLERLRVQEKTTLTEGALGMPLISFKIRLQNYFCIDSFFFKYDVNSISLTIISYSKKKSGAGLHFSEP